MDTPTFKPTNKNRNIKKIILITIGSLVVVALIGYGTIMLLRQIKAPTIVDNQQAAPAITKPSTEEAQKLGDATIAIAREKVAAGNQEDALPDYKKALEYYTITKNAQAIYEAKFAIQAIEGVIAAPENPGKPTGTKAGAKE